MLKNTIIYLTKENKKKTLVFTLKSNQKQQNHSNGFKRISKRAHKVSSVGGGRSKRSKAGLYSPESSFPLNRHLHYNN